MHPMKKTYLFLATLIFVSVLSHSLQAQSLVLEPSSKTVTCNVVVDTDNITAFDFYFTNTGDIPITLKWKRVYKDLGAGWDSSICDFGRCYSGIPDSGTMKEMPPNEKGILMALNLTAYPGAGPGLVKIFVYKAGTPDVGDTLTWIVNAAQTGVKQKSASNVIVYPSPATNSLKCSTGSDEILIRAIALYSIGGKKVLSLGGINMRDYQIDVSSISSGMYIARLETSDGLVTLQKFEKIK